MNAGTATGERFAATITSPTGNPFVVPGNAAGPPQAFTVTESGFPADTVVFIEQCDGVAPTTSGLAGFGFTGAGGPWTIAVS